MTLRGWEDDAAGSANELWPATAAEAAEGIASRVSGLRDRYAGLAGKALLVPLVEREFQGRLAVVSSFGAESAALLALVAEIDRRVPILFLDTGKLFGETLRYRDRLIDILRLTDVRTLHPTAEQLATDDADNMLWSNDPDRCCELRKVVPLASALIGFAAWVSGRKRYQGAARATLPVFEADGCGRIKINPFAGWSPAQIEDVFATRNLPRHPLVADGYLSIGCTTCTERVRPGEDPRAGRWRGHVKTECGIHSKLLSRLAR